MDGTNGLKETTRVTAPVASNTLSVNIFTARELGSQSVVVDVRIPAAITRSSCHTSALPKYKGSNCR
jgi:hypothetical protein